MIFTQSDTYKDIFISLIIKGMGSQYVWVC